MYVYVRIIVVVLWCNGIIFDDIDDTSNSIKCVYWFTEAYVCLTANNHATAKHQSGLSGFQFVHMECGDLVDLPEVMIRNQQECLFLPIGSMYGIYANMTGVYWWDPWW